MKWLKRFLVLIIVLVVLALAAGALWWYSFAPNYGGTFASNKVLDSVTIRYDSYGVPHIYASNEHDLYFALGYVHAKDRLWQMDLLRRVAPGRLSEIMGPVTKSTDVYFKTLGYERYAQIAVKKYLSSTTEPYQVATLAYLEGVNAFIATGDWPVEYSLLGVKPEVFKPIDIFHTVGYMGYSFAQAPITEPLVTKIATQLGPNYLQSLVLNWDSSYQAIPVYDTILDTDFSKLAYHVNRLQQTLPVPAWIGSNSWVLGPDKTKTGKVILCNDTHIGYAQPSVWFEAHLEAPGFSYYGNHLAGFPLSFIGHNQFAATGMTMFENDDIDLFYERLNEADSNQVWVNDHWEDLSARQETVIVKGENDTTFTVKESRHGPIMNYALEGIKSSKQAVAMHWTMTQADGQILEAAYLMSHGKTMADYRKAASMIHAPGLNIMYGDVNGNVAWWTTGKLMKRPSHVNSKIILDGASGKDEYLGYYDFRDNPHAENPKEGYVYSANNQPTMLADSTYYPGYYVPESRARRIVNLLEANDNWDESMMEALITDSYSSEVVAIKSYWLTSMQKSSPQSIYQQQMLEALHEWDGSMGLDNVGPTIYYRVLHFLLKETFADELGQDDYETFLSTHILKRSLLKVLQDEGSPWWDNIKTTETQESDDEVLAKAFKLAEQSLINQLGPEVDDWQWQKVHFLLHKHVLGQFYPLDELLNVGPIPAPAGPGTINNLSFKYNTENTYIVSSGPAMRRIVDFSHLENTKSILPTGQSGNPLSTHYNDQAQMFAKGQFRSQLMDSTLIVESQKYMLKIYVID